MQVCIGMTDAQELQVLYQLNAAYACPLYLFNLLSEIRV